VAEGGGEEQSIGARAGAPDVFISYASHDSAVANDVAVAIEGQRLPGSGSDLTDAALHAVTLAQSGQVTLSESTPACTTTNKTWIRCP
jgi:hypothetical protein